MVSMRPGWRTSLYSRRMHFKTKRYRKKIQKAPVKYAPQRLPRTRRRALTCPLPQENSRRSWNPFKIRQKTHDQSQSILLSRLPTEIRQIIWSEVIGGRLLHIVRAPKRLLAIECAENFGPDLETSLHGCWGWTNGSRTFGTIPGYYNDPISCHPAKPANLLPLLQVCRMIYTEAIPILYEKNIFDINHSDTFTYLKQSVLPKRLNLIRVMNFAWECKHFPGSRWVPPNSLATWSEVCDIIASFSGLQQLTMHLKDNFMPPSAANWKDEWEPLLAALQRIKVAKRFDMFLPWSEDKCIEVMKEKEYPFRLAPHVDAPLGFDRSEANLEICISIAGP